MMKTVALTISVYLAWLCVAQAAKPSERSPGMVTYITEEVLSKYYEDIVLNKELKKKLEKFPIRDIEGRIPTVYWSELIYRLSDIFVAEYQSPRALATVTEAEGYAATIYVPWVRFGGNYSMEFDIGPWREASRNGNFSITLEGVTLKMLLNPSIHEQYFTLTSSNGTISIHDIKIDLGDPVSNALLAKTDSQDLKRRAEEHLLSVYQFMTKFKYDASYNLSDEIYLDRTILKTPMARDGYCEIYYRGEFRYRGDNSDFDSSPGRFQPLPPSKDVSYRMSEFLFNSFGHVVHKHKLLSCSFTKLDLPERQRHLLLSTCYTEDCFGKRFPKVADKYPGSSVEYEVTSAKRPWVEVKKGLFKIFISLNIKGYARHQKNDKQSLLFSIRFQMTSVVDFQVRNNRLLFLIQEPDVEISTLDTHIGTITKDKLLPVLEPVVQKVIGKVFANLRKEGVDLGLPSSLLVDEYEMILGKGDATLEYTVVTAKSGRPDTK